MKRFLHLLMTLAILPAMNTQATPQPPPEPDRVVQARKHVTPELGAYFGRPVFIRIIKEDWELELWVRNNGQWSILKTYEIAGMSGELGPKTAEGDCQAPEGFYEATPRGLNPHSMYHLSFNIGYPNAFDVSQGRTGSYIMIHGSDVSIGCFAMTDAGIEEIYTMVNEAFKAGQSCVPVQVYPFRMTHERMMEEATSPHYDFWKRLLPGWQHTEQCNEPAPGTYET